MDTREIIELTLGDGDRAFHPVLLLDSTNLVLVDTGLPNTFGQLVEAIEGAGFSVSQLTSVILTHHDIDHIGNMGELLTANPAVTVMAHEIETPYLDGRKTPLKLAALQQDSSFYKTFKAGFDANRFEVDKQLKDNEVLPFCGGTCVFLAPGHTLGNICLFVREEKALIAGDTFNVFSGELVGANPEHTYDQEMANSSVQRILDLDIEVIYTYHGGTYRGSIRDVSFLG